MTGFSLQRRKFLITGGLGALALGTVGAGIGARTVLRGSSRAAWIESVIHNNLPGIEIEAASMQTFVDGMLTSNAMQMASVKLAVFADRYAPWLPARIASARDRLERLERRLLTDFLLGSNFFRVADPKQATITWRGPATVCANPFRSLRNPSA